MSVETPAQTGTERLTVVVTINGQEHRAEVEARLLLVHFIRETVGLTGTHIGCDTTSCGACVVLLDDVPIKSCTLFAVQADGRQIRTVEGLEQGGQLHPIQTAFWEEHGLQCGFCTPGMMMTSVALLERNLAPSEDEIRQAISGNLCRCTGYVNIVKSVQHAANALREAQAASDSTTTAEVSPS
jgi:carbon-monoxide dehydrogenase small subunit